MYRVLLLMIKNLLMKKGITIFPSIKSNKTMKKLWIVSKQLKKNLELKLVKK